jgi:hypothetical protein
MNGRRAGTPKVSTEERTMGLLSWFRNRELGGPGDWFERLVLPRGHRPDPKLDRLKQAVSEDVAEMEAEDRRYFRQDGPGKIEDDL